jgi:hypothetical protein
VVPLDREYPAAADAERCVLMKIAWWTTQPVGLATGFAGRCDVKVGQTLAVDDRGRLRALLRGGTGGWAARRREAFLQRLIESGNLLPPGRDLGPDGEPLTGVLHVTQDDGALRMGGSFQALHLAGSD